MQVYKPGGEIVLKTEGVGEAENFLVFDNLEFESMPLEERTELLKSASSDVPGEEIPQYTAWDEFKWTPCPPI